MHRTHTLCLMAHALQGKPRTIESWQELILLPTTWADVAFVQLIADHFRVSFHHIGVNDLSHVFDMGTIMPCDQGHTWCCTVHPDAM